MESIIKFEMGGHLCFDSIKNAALRKETQNLEQIQMDACKLYDGTRAAVDKLNYERSKILARIQGTKLYEKDGFKNMSEYAESIGLNVGKSAISQMVTAGRVYNDKNAPQPLKDLSYSTLGAMGALLNNEDTKKSVYADAEAGKLTNITQADAKEYVDARKPQRAEVVKLYEVYEGNERFVGERETYKIAPGASGENPDDIDDDSEIVTLFTKEEVSEITSERGLRKVEARKGDEYMMYIGLVGTGCVLWKVKEHKPESNGKTKDNPGALMQIVIRKLMRGEPLTAKEQEVADKLNAD